MRNLKKNEKLIKALNYKRTEDVLDSEGNKTGEKKVIYSPLYTFYVNISGARGSSQSEIFGTDISYDKTFVISKLLFEKLKIDENTVFFIDMKPKYKDGTPLYNYTVLKIADSINEVAIAIKSVKSND